MVTKRTFPRETTAPSQLSPCHHHHQGFHAVLHSMTWTCWSTWEAPATALAAAEAAGMPVRRPRRPAAVSAADAAGAGPELGCAGHLERPAEAPNGEVRSLSVGRCVSHRVGRSSNVDGSISRLGLLFLGSCARAGPLGFPFPKEDFGVSSLLRVSRSICGCVSACLSTRLLRRAAALLFPSASSRSFSAGLAR